MNRRADNLNLMDVTITYVTLLFSRYSTFNIGERSRNIRVFTYVVYCYVNGRSLTFGETKYNRKCNCK